MNVVGKARSWSWRMPILFGVCLLLAVEWFMTARAVTSSSAELDVIYGNAIPSIDELSEVLDGITDLRRELGRLALDPSSTSIHREVGSNVESLLLKMKVHAATYEKLPAFPDELPLQRDMDRALDALERAARDVLRAEGAEGARRSALEEFPPAADAAHAAVNGALRFDARQVSRTARYVYGAEGWAVAWTRGITGSFVLVVLALGLWLDRTVTRAERLREETVAELDAFAGRIAHDLRGPLGPVLLAVGMLEQDPNLSERGRGLVARIEKAAHRMTALIDGLLAFARAGAKPEPGASTDVADVASSVEATVKPLAEAERATLDLVVEKDLRVAASSGVATSIVQNLVRNALLYLGDSVERRVVVRARALSPSSLSIEVEDTGPGIPGDVLRRLWKPFERGATSVPGHGLGLATVKRLAEGHGGAVEVASTVGAGSVFRVTLPRAS